MRAYQEQDFEKMATRVVDRFMHGEKLADVAAAEAQQSQLNPDQIDRLAHSANTMAFLRLMEQQKAQGTPDMTSEFDPIDARQILQLLMGQMGGAHPEGGAMPHAEPDGDEMPLPDETHGHVQPHTVGADGGCFGTPDGTGERPIAPLDGGARAYVPPNEAAPPIDDDNDGPFPKGEKQKAKEDKDKKPKKAPPSDAKKDEAKEAAFRARRMRKLADVLEDQLKQAELAFDDAFGVLQNQLRKAHGAPSAAAFEKDALALHDSAAGRVVLAMVQESRGWPVTTPDDANVKTAALVDRHLVDDTETNRTFATLVKIAAEASRIKQGIEHVRGQCS